MQHNVEDEMEKNHHRSKLELQGQDLYAKQLFQKKIQTEYVRISIYVHIRMCICTCVSV